MWESSKMCKQALQQSRSGLMTCFPPLSGPPAPPPPQKKMFAFQQLLEETRSELRRPLCNAEGTGWGRLGSGGVPTWGTWLRAGGGPGSHLHFPEQTNKQRPGIHSTEREGGGWGN